MAKIIRNGVVYGSNKASDITFSSDSLYNIESDNVQSAIMTIDEVIGDINELSTTTQSDIVDAINEINTKIGDRASLETVNKTSAVIAINEVLGNLGDKSTLTTTNKGSAIGAINELNQNLDDKANHDEGFVENLLNPTLATTTKNGVTCTNNGDGTYTLNGTATANAIFKLTDFNLEIGKKYRLTGCPTGGNTSSTYCLNAQGIGSDISEGFTWIDTTNTRTINIVVYKNAEVSNLVFKPMICKNLNATYDDFVPYNYSRKALAENKADFVDAKGLELFGWIAPKLSDTVYDYIDSNGIYHKKVGRIIFTDKNEVIQGADNNRYAFYTTENMRNLMKFDQFNAISSWGLKEISQISWTGEKEGLYINKTYLNFKIFNYTLDMVKERLASESFILYFELATEETKSIYYMNEIDNIVSDVNSLNENLSPKTEQAINIFSGGIFNVNHLVKNGKTVLFDLNISSNTQIPSNPNMGGSVLCTIPENFKPIESLNLICILHNGSWQNVKIGYASVKPNGEISIGYAITTEGIKTALISGSWVTN